MLTVPGVLDRYDHTRGRAGGVYYAYELAVDLETVLSALDDVRALDPIDVSNLSG
ncbi:hypothetical protein [Halomicrobium urmianum]|uniref:hypothetical protein n=1 Tax=Halomicrobium urmianum TaxID=1586233 RepID=UPI001CD9DCA7|nr:hypothetical protein [Halomicrobium urmianum]